MFLFETLQGEVVKSAFAKDNILSVSGLSEGIYVVKSLNKRGVSHSLGTFIYKKFQKNRKKLPKNLVESNKSSTFALAIQK